MIGASLSLCVLDILRGKVELESVEKIYAATCFTDPEVILEHYKDNYWRKREEESRRIVMKLWKEGRIHQSRLIDNKLQPWPTPIWYDNLDQFIARQEELGNIEFAQYLESIR